MSMTSLIDCMRRSQSTTQTFCPDIAATRARHIDTVVLPSFGRAEVIATTFTEKSSFE